MQEFSAPTLRIHGDNIIECERALRVIARALSLEISFVASPIYFPRYALGENSKTRFDVELLAGHARWNVNLQNVLRAHGAPLREATDAVITNYSADGTETLLFALEFSSALPAGNNAWQRHGRALTCATIGAPFLYFAEVGGMELGTARVFKAPRFPNPIIPFSYLTADELFQTICVPVYVASPTLRAEMRAEFSPALGQDSGLALIRSLLTELPFDNIHSELKTRALRMTELLARRRKRTDTWRANEWSEFLACDTYDARKQWLEMHSKGWQKKSGAKVRTSQTFQELRNLFSRIGCLTIGGGDIPLCWIPADKRPQLANEIGVLYENKMPRTWGRWIGARNEPLFVVWVTGFKPDGEDSRPDRGLLPLLRMLVGYDAEVLTIVSGPARPAMWARLRREPQRLAEQNGLWEAILGLSNAVLADSVTLSEPIWLKLPDLSQPAPKKISFAAATSPTLFSEQDVDTALHLLFGQGGTETVFEGLCNPPGGDWSGLSLLNWQTRTEYRWTSLPRVSAHGGKRPDHVIQFNVNDKNILLAIESKSHARTLEMKIGPRLGRYVEQLIQTPATISRSREQAWHMARELRYATQEIEIISGGAFCLEGKMTLPEIARRCRLNAVFAFDFRSSEQPSLLRVFLDARADFLLPILRELARHLDGQLEIDVG